MIHQTMTVYSFKFFNKNEKFCCTIKINTLRPRQDGCHLPDDIFKCIFLNENVRILIKISLKFAPKGPINNIPALVQIMAWRRPGDKPLSEPMMFNLPTHICVTRPQWIKYQGNATSPKDIQSFYNVHDVYWLKQGNPQVFKQTWNVLLS